MKINTHLITNYSDPKKGTVLSRISDGMVIGRRVERLVAWGEDPRQQQQRAFTDETWALCFLRKVADADQQAVMDAAGHDTKGVAARIEEVDGDRRVIAAGNVQ